MQRAIRSTTQAVRYFQTFRCVAQLVPVLVERATGGAGGGAFGSERGMARLVQHIRATVGCHGDIKN